MQPPSRPTTADARRRPCCRPRRPTQVFLTPGHLCLALEYAPAGTLFDLVQRCGRLAEPQAAPLFGQLVAALAWCHSQVGRAGGLQ